MTTKKHTRTFYEFFAGTGMARLGLKHAWACAWANDNDPRKNSIYRHNFGDAHLDTRSVDVIADAIAAHAADPKSVPLPLPLGVEMAWASFPCQDLSLAGWQRGMSAGRSGTYWPFWQIMFQLHRMGQRPRIIVLENVRGLLYGENLIGLCESLAALGMRLGALHMDARFFVPQSRPRIFIVAVDALLDISSVSSEKPTEGPWHPRSLQAAYEQLPEELKSRWVWWNIGLPPISPVKVSSIIEPHPADVTLDSQTKTRQLISLMEDRSRQKVRTAKSSTTGAIGFLYKRTRNGQQRAEVRFDGIAGCLRTPKGGSSRQTVLLRKAATCRVDYCHESKRHD
ncbi:MAG: DNA cytosine methyltransferase [bacterium]|nr:DNA cytosine methyltransferase [bacterium]